MTIRLLVVGKTDDASLHELIKVYEKRLGHYIRFEFEVIPNLKKTKHLDPAQQKIKEGELILDKVSTTDFLILLDEQGKLFTSEGFSTYLQKRMNSGLKQLVFVIGGPYGFSEEIYSRAQAEISLSKMTFSHQMIRPFFVEQLYRAFTILKNEPYHHQ